MFGLGLEAVTLHSRVSLLPSTIVLSRGYVVCNDGESERRQRLLVSSVNCLYDINAKTECTDWNISEIVRVAGAWKLFCKKERGLFLPRAIHSFLRPLLPGACLAGHISKTEISEKKKKKKKEQGQFWMETKNILGFRSDVPVLARDEDLTYQKCKDNQMSLKKSRTAKNPFLLL